MIKLLGILITLLSSYISSPTEVFQFSTIASEDGLSQNDVCTIEEDRLGNLWFGTSDGLNKYDGYDITVYKFDPNNPHTLPSNIINKLLQDSNGKLWVCTANGLAAYDDENDHFKRIPLKGLHSVEDLVEIKPGMLLLTTRNASYTYEIETGETQELMIDGKALRFYASRAHEDEIILCSMFKSIETLHFKDGKLVRKYPPLQIPNFGRAILPKAEGEYIIGTNGSGTILANIKESKYEQFFNDNGEFVNSAVENNGVIWVGSDKGLRAYRDKEKIWSSRATPAIEMVVRALHIDKNGGLWVGTNYTGAKYWNRSKDSFKPIVFKDDPDALDGDVVTLLKKGDSGDLWIGTKYGGLNRFNLSTGDRTNYKIFNSKSIAFSKDNKILYVGTESNGLYKIDINSNSITHIPKPNDVMSLVLADGRKLWLGCLVGLFLYNPDDNSRTKIKLGPPGTITRILTIFPNSDSTVWIGTKESLKLYKIKGELIFEDITPEGFDNLIQIQCLKKTNDGNLWIGTADGLYLKRSSSKPEGVDGLQSVTIRGIEDDDNGNLWISTDNYICRFNIGTGERRIYGLNSGLQCSQFMTYAHCKDDDGSMYFGGIKGVSKFHPENMMANENTIAPVLSGLMLNNKEIHPDDESEILEKDISLTDEINLKYYQNSITLRFTCPDFISEHGNTFRYKLEGVDEDWVNARNREAAYSNLDKGRYTFRLICANSDGVWHPNETTLKIRVKPIWYRTLAAQICFALVILALLAFSFSKFLNRINKKNEMKIAELAKNYEEKIQRARISRFIDPNYNARQQDIDFLTKVLDCIDTNCSSAEFNVEAMASELCMSRGNLHLKIKSICGKTVVELIKIIRLEHACELLREGKMSIAEIADQTGFQTSAYFITTFKKEFGVTPGKYYRK